MVAASPPGRTGEAALGALCVVMSKHDLIAAGLTVGDPLPPPGAGLHDLLASVAARQDIAERVATKLARPARRAPRRPSAASLIRDIEKTGKTVRAVTRLADGSVRLEFGAEATDRNEWDEAFDGKARA
jgi:hypothetical protein